MGDITPLLRLSTLLPLLPVLTILSVFTAPTVGIIGENLTGALGSALKERPIKADLRSSIIASPAKLTDGSKSSPSARASEEEDTELSLCISSATLYPGFNIRGKPIRVSTGLKQLMVAHNHNHAHSTNKILPPLSDKNLTNKN
ncbi:hypothetical protein AYI68_g4100 [Smittium mucronatum]|uniref:Uncharacterized protein n=1 Tax=Smittium mucronatum TaxID=133383 RepID=A0A1R0GY78_9FUNG|nr:hypothetical protein AYI68_g4100 [Smittium mucronatum]